MIVMPSNGCGSFWHILGRETGRIGHLYSPGGQCGPWPWLPYAMDNGAFACWRQKTNTFDYEKWSKVEIEWRKMLLWSQSSSIRPRWAIVPDIPGNCEETLDRWERYEVIVRDSGIEPAIAVQDGMTPEMVRALKHQPKVICIGGTTEWKWETVEIWAKEFSRVHVLRVNSPDKLYYLESLGIESCDGTGWNRGTESQTMGLERWARSKLSPTNRELIYKWLCCRNERDKRQTLLF